MRLARGFIRDFGDAADRVDEMQAAGLHAEIAGLAHQVKGTSGYLAATALADTALALERAAKAAPVDRVALADAAEAFNRELGRVLSAAAELVAGGGSGDGARPQADYERARSLAAAARPLVEAGNYDAVATLETLVGALAGSELQEVAEAALEQFDEADLSAACATLDRLIEGLR